MSAMMKVKDMEYCKEQATEAYNRGDYERGEYWTNEASRLRFELGKEVV